jgi:hypothetical protein
MSSSGLFPVAWAGWDGETVDVVNRQLKFAQRLIKHGHALGSIGNTMEIMQLHKKGTHLNTLERFYIHKEYTHNNHLNEEYADNNNQIFNTILYVSNNMATNPPT